MTNMLLIDVKGASDHVSRNELIRKMGKMGADGDLVRWTGSFLLKGMRSLVVEGHQYQTVEVEIGVP